MDDRAVHFRVGVLVVATISLLVFLVVLFGKYPKSFTGQNTIYIRFPSAPGVSKDTPVRKSGILIGRVTDVQLTDDDGVLVTAALDADRTIRQNEVCQIRTGTIFGDAMLEFVPGPETGSREPITDQMYLDGVVTGDLMEVLQSFGNLEDDVRRALNEIQLASGEVALAARNLTTFLGENQQQFGQIMQTTQSVLQRTDEALAKLDFTLESVNSLVGDEELRLRLREAIALVPQIITDASGLIGAVDQVAVEARRRLADLEGLTRPLGDQGTQIVATVVNSAAKLDELITQLTLFSRSLNTSQGTVGQLVHNPDLYIELQLAAQNVRDITSRLKPLVDDLRVFADKIARDPGRVASGVLQPRQTGLK